MKIQCRILLPLTLILTSCATVDKEVATSTGEEAITSSGEKIIKSSGEWINLYDDQTTFGEIIELRGPPFDVQIDEDKIRLSLYYMFGESVDRDLTTSRRAYRKEEVEFDSNGKFLNVSVQEKERVWGGGAIGYAGISLAAAAIGSPVMIDPVGLTDVITTASANPRSEEMNRIKKFLKSRNLTFSEKQWYSQRFIYNLWVKNEKDNEEP